MQGRRVRFQQTGKNTPRSGVNRIVVTITECQVEIPVGNEIEIASQRIKYRVGINLGDVVFDGNDIFGDGVNVAARLEGLAEPGGVCISDIVHQAVNEQGQKYFRDMGGQRVKNISRPIRVWQWTPDAPVEHKKPEMALQQRVRYCDSEDGTQIAWARIGEGPGRDGGPRDDVRVDRDGWLRSECRCNRHHATEEGWGHHPGEDGDAGFRDVMVLVLLGIWRDEEPV